MTHTQPIRRLAVNMNGITIAYVMGLVNACVVAVVAFGVTISPEESAAIIGVVNAALVLAVHVGHRVGETVASGAAARASQAHNDLLIAHSDEESRDAKQQEKDAKQEEEVAA